MILDKQLILSSSQAVTASAASENYINFGALGNAYGKELWLVIQTREAATADGSATVNFVVQTDSTSAFSTPAVLAETGAIGKASITLNSEPMKIKLSGTVEQYMRVYYTVATGPLTAGKFDAFIVADVKV